MAWFQYPLATLDEIRDWGRSSSNAFSDRTSSDILNAIIGDIIHALHGCVADVGITESINSKPIEWHMNPGRLINELYLTIWPIRGRRKRDVTLRTPPFICHSGDIEATRCCIKRVVGSKLISCGSTNTSKMKILTGVSSQLLHFSKLSQWRI